MDLQISNYKSSDYKPRFGLTPPPPRKKRYVPKMVFFVLNIIAEEQIKELRNFMQ